MLQNTPKVNILAIYIYTDKIPHDGSIVEDGKVILIYLLNI